MSVATPNAMNLDAEQQELLSHLPPAEKQTRLESGRVLNSANSGMIIRREGQVLSRYRNEARECAMEIAEYTTEHQEGFISTFLYEETYGKQDRIHWLIHLRTLADYMRFHRMAATEPGFGEIFMRNRDKKVPGGVDWTKMFPEETFRETVYSPHYWGCAGTRSAQPVPPAGSRTAGDQTGQPAGEIVHSVNGRVLTIRTARVRPEFRSEAREFARTVADCVNRNLSGHVSCFLFEEHFGAPDRIHVWLHARTYQDYELYTDFTGQDEEYRDLLNRPWASAYDGLGPWGRFFVADSFEDLLLCPQHPTKDF